MYSSRVVNGVAVAILVVAGLAIGFAIYVCLTVIGWPLPSALVPAVIVSWTWISVARGDYLEIISRAAFRTVIPFANAQRSLFQAAGLRSEVLSLSVIAFAVVIAVGLHWDRVSDISLFSSFGIRVLAGGEVTLRAAVSGVLAALAGYFVATIANWGLRYLVVGNEVATVFQRGRRLFSFEEAKAKVV